MGTDARAALDDFQAAVRLNPRSLAGLYNQAMLLVDKLGRLEDALHKVVCARPAQQKVRDAVKAGKLPRAFGAVLLDAALAAGVVTKEEVELIAIAERARAEAIAVDAFGGPRDGAGERSHSPAISAC